MHQRNRRGVATGALAVASSVLLLAACGGDSGTGPRDDGASTVPVSASFKASGGFQAPGSVGPSFTRTIRDSAGNVLEIDRIRMVFTGPRVKPSGTASCDGGQCVEIPAPTTLVDFPLGGGLVTLGNVALEFGTWDGVQVEVREPTGGEDDDFIQDHPAFDMVSLRVEGTFNGDPFTFASDVSGTVLVQLDPPLELDPADGTANVTVEVDFNGWFRDQNNVLVDPATAEDGGENESLVEVQILDSFKAFQDNDRDGNPGSAGDGI